MNTSSIVNLPRPFASEALQSPSIVITLPFEPKMTPKGPLEASLKTALSQAERRLMAEYTRDTALPLLQQLQEVIRDLNYATHKNSLAIFVSPSAAKVLYLDTPLDSQVLVDSDFRARDLATPRNTNVPYLVLLLSGRLSKMYYSDGVGLTLIKTNVFRPVYAYTHELPENVANFTDPATRKEDLLDKFLHHMDQGLTTIIDAYPLPVFVLATDRVCGHFAQITRNTRHIATYIHKNCMHAKEAELLDALQPYLNDWELVRQQMALKQIELALETGKLVSGIEAVGKAAISRNARLLVVEKNFGVRLNPSYEGAENFYIHDQVDAIVEKVLLSGGQVEWVDEGQLAKEGHIALIRYY